LVNKRKTVKQDITFAVLGDGPLRQQFEKYAAQQQVKCEFTGRLPYEQMVGRMCSCDILVNPIVKDAAQSITNKVGDYALAALPVISTQECQEYRDLIDEYGFGFNCDAGDSEQVAEAVVQLANSPELRKQMGNAARRLGVERFDRRHTYKSIVQILLE